jgi:hypothetical protein
MRPITAGTIIQATAGTVSTPGTITGSSIDWTPYYEPDLAYVCSAGSITSGGSVVAHVQGSPDNSAWTSIGSVLFASTAGGTVTQAVDVAGGALSAYRYVRGLVTCASGSVHGVSSVFVGQPRTRTS